jgi:hypothetical protein
MLESSNMSHVWQVKVQDHEGQPVEDATVVMAAADTLRLAAFVYPYAGVPATHAHEGAGRYVASTLELSAGEWLLIVQRPGKSPVVQPLDVRVDARGELFAAPPLAKLVSAVSSRPRRCRRPTERCVRRASPSRSIRRLKSC